MYSSTRNVALFINSSLQLALVSTLCAAAVAIMRNLSWGDFASTAFKQTEGWVAVACMALQLILAVLSEQNEPQGWNKINYDYQQYKLHEETRSTA